MEEVKEKKREYSNGVITVVWKPDKCTHASFCWKELPEVFNPDNRPWVNINGASSERIMQQVERCPSGALTYYKNGEKPEEKTQKGDKVEVEINMGGPLVIESEIYVKLGDGTVVHKIEGAAFCRCGKSKTQPFCDGTHQEIKFNK